MSGRQGHNAVPGHQGFQRTAGTPAEIELCASDDELALNEPYDYLRPPFPVSAAQVLDYWTKVAIPDEDVRKMARHISPAHPSSAEMCVRLAGILRDADAMVRVHGERGSAEARTLRETNVVFQSGRIEMAIDAMQSFRLYPIVERGLDAAVVDQVSAVIEGGQVTVDGQVVIDGGNVVAYVGNPDVVSNSIAMSMHLGYTDEFIPPAKKR